MNKRISLCQLEDIYKSSFGTEDVRIKKFVDKDGNVHEGNELKKLMEADNGSNR